MKRPYIVRKQSPGFSLVEMLVVIGIIGIITSVVLFQYGKYDSEALLNSLAYDIALSAREAQTLGISVQGGSSSNFLLSYGVHFTPGTEYILFRDDGDGVYEEGEELNTYTIGQGNAIAGVCVNGTTCDRTALDIVFTRPEPDAAFASVPSVASITSGEIVVTTTSGNTRQVTILSTGQISVGQQEVSLE